MWNMPSDENSGEESHYKSESNGKVENPTTSSRDQNSDEESDYDPKFEGNLYDIMTKLEFCNYTCQTNSKYCH